MLMFQKEVLATIPRWEKIYNKRKSSGEGSNPSSNPYPLKKEEE